jgi:hypothetical protein
MSTTVKPLSSFVSSNLNPRVKTYASLAERVAMSLGHPQINIEAHTNQVYDNISISCEMFSKFAGYTEEYLVFHTDLYVKGLGVKVDDLFSQTPAMRELRSVELSGVSEDSTTGIISGGYDYDMGDYRRVIDVFAFEQGTTTGVNTLFTLEQTLAQQTYFSYALGKYGFDLVSWYSMKQWLDVRSKLLSQDYYYDFDDRSQYLRLLPEPTTGSTRAGFYGAVGAYIEKPLRDLVKEPWVYQYALALTKISLGRIRGKYTGTNLFGGGTANADTILSEGKEEKATLEAKLYEGSAPGFGDAAPPLFFVG